MTEYSDCWVWVVSYLSRPDGECMQYNQRAFSIEKKAMNFIAEIYASITDIYPDIDNITIIKLKVE